MGGQFLVCGTKVNILSHDPLIPTQAQLGELKVQAARLKFFQKRAFHEIRQANLVNIDDRGQKREDEEPNRNPKPAEVNPANSPKPPLMPGAHTRSSLRAKREIRTDVTKEQPRKLHNPRLAFEHYGGVNVAGGRLAAKFQIKLPAAFQLQRQVSAVRGKPKGRSALLSPSRPNDGGGLHNATNGFLDRRIIDDPL